MTERSAVQTLIEHAAQFLDAAFGGQAKAASSLPRDSLLQATALLECAHTLSSRASSSSAAQLEGKGESESESASCVSAALDVCVKLLRLPQLLSSSIGNGGVSPNTTVEGRSTAEPVGDAASNAEVSPPDAAAASADTTTTLQDIIGNEQAKRMLLDNVVLPLRAGSAFRKHVLSGIRAGGGNVLLYGPPGNGKTKLARASANAANAKFFPVNPSSILSKYQGESERYVRQLFALAKKTAPSVIFFDELDSIGCARGSAGDDVQHRRLLAELLMQFNSVSADDKVVVLGATNRIEDVDEALLRRFHARICVAPPSHAARVALLKSFMATVEHDLSAKQFDAIAHATEGWSGADIEVLCREAALGPVRALFVARASGDQRRSSTDVQRQTAIASSSTAEVKRPAAEVTPPREGCSGLATAKRVRVDAVHLSKELAHEKSENAERSLAPGDVDASDDEDAGDSAALSTVLLEQLLDDGAVHRWRVAPVTYKDFLAAYATILSVDVAAQDVSDLLAVPAA